MRKGIKFLSIICVLSLLTSCLSAYNLRIGKESFKRQDYRQAFIRLLPEADHGNPEAQYAVGYMYYYGEGVVEDRRKALYWISLAAKHGQPDAMRAMGVLASQDKN